MNLDFSQLEEVQISGVDMYKVSITSYNNLVPKSIDTDNSVYNKLGYINGYRLNSSGTLSADYNSVASGFIPCSSEDLIRISGVQWEPSNISHSYIAFYDSSFTNIGSLNCYKDTAAASGYTSTVRGVVKFIGTDDTATELHPSVQGAVTVFDQITFSDGSDVAYCRINCSGIGANMIVTLNENIDSPITWRSPRNFNLVPLSVDSDGVTIFNGVGYKEGVRLSSSGAEKAQNNSVVTGFIPASIGDVIRMSGVTWGSLESNGYCYIIFYDSSFTKIATVNKYKQSSENNHVSNVGGDINETKSSVLTDENGVTTFNIVFNVMPNYSYIRISAEGKGADMIVTVNEEITI